MKIDYRGANRCWGLYKRNGKQCVWEIWRNTLHNRYEAYTRGDRDSECDVGWHLTEHRNKRYFATEDAAMKYLADVVGC